MNYYDEVERNNRNWDLYVFFVSSWKTSGWRKILYISQLITHFLIMIKTRYRSFTEFQNDGEIFNFHSLFNIASMKFPILFIFVVSLTIFYRNSNCALAEESVSSASFSFIPLIIINYFLITGWNWPKTNFNS